MRPNNPEDEEAFRTELGEPETGQDLVKALAELRILAIRLDFKVVGAIVDSAIGMIPLTKH